jgi:acyl carrier protein
VIDRIRSVLRQHGRLASDPDGLTLESDLYQHGLTSHASVNVMLALEDAFEVEFPEAMLRRRTFESLGQIASSLESLLGARPAAV